MSSRNLFLLVACSLLTGCVAVTEPLASLSALFTRIAASDPTMWRDVFLANKEAVLEMLGRFNEDLSVLTRAIRHGDGDTLFKHFSRTREIRRGIVEIGQDSAAPDFGRPHPHLGALPRPYSSD